jgi:hypothetical protein
MEQTIRRFRGAAQQSLEGTVNGLCVRDAGAGRQYVPATLVGRFWAAPRVHRWAAAAGCRIVGAFVAFGADVWIPGRS